MNVAAHRSALVRIISGLGVVVIAMAALAFSANSLQRESTAGWAESADQKPQVLLPTGARLDPAGRSFDVGNMPLAMALSPHEDFVILSLNGWRQQGIQVVDRATGKVMQTLDQPAAFFGLAFSPDGETLFASGGNEDAVFRYAWREGKATLIDRIALAEKNPKADGTRFPAGLAVSRDGRSLYVAENIGDSLAVVDLAGKRVVQRLKTGHYPHNVALAVNDRVYVSAWGGDRVDVFRVQGDGLLAPAGTIAAGRHPGAMVLNTSGSRLFVASASTDRVAVVDTRSLRVIKYLADRNPSATPEGSTPNALALSRDGRRLFVAEADNNAVAIFDLGPTSAGVKSSRIDRLAGRIPCGWYPTALAVTANSLLVANGKGRGSVANPAMRQPNSPLIPSSPDYALGQLNGTITDLPLTATGAELRRYSERVRKANNWDATRPPPKYPPFKHVIYIIKENRTYDQIFGDMADGDGDASLLFFSSDSTPNHRDIARRFGLFDHFFVNAEVSQQGHQWSTAAYVTDYTEKTTPSIYSNRRAAPDDEGDVDDPVSGYRWDAVRRKGLSLRNYGEFALPAADDGSHDGVARRYRALKANLAPYTSPDYPAFDMDIRDQQRADVWLAEFNEFVKKGNLPALEIMHLPGDHTSGGRAGKRTPRAYMADNDLALGRMIEALSKSPYWRDTVVFVLEDDAQDGPDHVDSHRSVLMVISAYNTGRPIHRFANTTDVIATVEEILGLKPLSQFDYFGRPLREIFSAEPNLHPYEALTPAQSLDEMNASSGRVAEESEQLDFSKADVADTDTFNRVLWRAIKGDAVPYPSLKRMASLDYLRAR